MNLISYLIEQEEKLSERISDYKFWKNVCWLFKIFSDKIEKDDENRIENEEERNNYYNQYISVTDLIIDRLEQSKEIHVKLF